eukprot:8690829-Alexandrium_andersonii.AAC.1
MLKKGDSTCGQALDGELHHALTCKRGGAANRIHNAVATSLARSMREGGYETRHEVSAPELGEWKRGRW